LIRVIRISDEVSHLQVFIKYWSSFESLSLKPQLSHTK